MVPILDPFQLLLIVFCDKNSCLFVSLKNFTWWNAFVVNSPFNAFAANAKIPIYFCFDLQSWHNQWFVSERKILKVLQASIFAMLNKIIFDFFLDFSSRHIYFCCLAIFLQDVKLLCADTAPSAFAQFCNSFSRLFLSRLHQEDLKEAWDMSTCNDWRTYSSRRTN